MNISKCVFLLICVMLVSNCSTQSIQSVNNTTDNADDLFIVDCLLPGQIRKLGQLATYLTARRPIKTTAGDCGIRGGEYVAYDRASYATSLKVWLPRAQAGEAEAQVYVGEIYEKGLGLAPDFNVAAQWYKKAADQNNSRAQINLGYLYERGQGVSKDLATAMSWYKKSSGLENTGIPYAATLETNAANNDLRTEIKFLKTELANSRNESTLLSKQLDKTQQLIDKDNDKLQTLNQRLDNQKQQLQTSDTQANSLESEQLQQIIARNEQEISAQQQKILVLEAKYKTEFSSLNDKLQATEKRANQILVDLKQQKSTNNQAQVQFLQNQAQLAKTEQQLIKLKKDAKEETDTIKRTESTQTNDQQQKTDKANRLLAIEQQKSSQLQQTIAQLESEKDSLEKKIKKNKNTGQVLASSNKPEIEIIDPPFVIVRGMPTVTLRSVVQQRDIIGKIIAKPGLLSLTVNDKKSIVDDQGLFKSNVKLVGESTAVNIVAIDKTGARANLEFILSLSKAINNNASSTNTTAPSSSLKEPTTAWKSIDFGNYHALVIGNKNYKKVPVLDTPINDAEAIETLLKNRYGFKTTLIKDGTRYQILSALNKLRAELTEKDNLLIYYAGHGELDKVNMRGHWLPIDADADNNANWISTVAITDILNMMSAKHIMVVSDSCYSGAMTRSSLARMESGMSNNQKSEWLKAMLKARSRTVLTSGGLKPVMDGGGGDKHSVFAKAFIGALENNATLLEGQSLYRKVSARIIAIAAGYGIEQVPEYAPIRHAGHESGEFFFAPKGS